MQIRVKREDLIRQLPYLRLPLIMEHDEGEWIYLVGEEVLPGGHPLLNVIPQFFDIFSPTEAGILKEMYGREYVPISILLKYTTGHSQNSVDVHIKNIRTKIIREQLPLEVVSHRGFGRGLRVNENALPGKDMRAG